MFESFELLINSLKELGLYLVNPGQRIFYLYLISTLLIASAFFWIKEKRKNFLSFFKFLFPKKIWLDRSAKQDYQLLVINKIIRNLLLAPALIAAAPIALSITQSLEWIFGIITPITQSKSIAVFSFTLILFILDDLSRFLLHWLLHHVPWLWEIHKVHHSAKVLTPFTVYRSHPIENYLFACRLAFAQGLSIGFCFYLFGPLISVYEIAGANVFVFLFNMAGANLRHSHIWLSWGKGIEKWFISPAQHQIHHSDNPKHFDANLGSALAIWDRMTGSLILANEVGRLRFGVGGKFIDYQNLIEIYWLPIKSIITKKNT